MVSNARRVCRWVAAAERRRAAAELKEARLELGYAEADRRQAQAQRVRLITDELEQEHSARTKRARMLRSVAKEVVDDLLGRVVVPNLARRQEQAGRRKIARSVLQVQNGRVGFPNFTSPKNPTVLPRQVRDKHSLRRFETVRPFLSFESGRDERSVGEVRCWRAGCRAGDRSSHPSRSLSAAVGSAGGGEIGAI